MFKYIGTNSQRRGLKNVLFFSVVWLALGACSHTVYVVRHAEKVTSGDSLGRMMANDPPLSEAGKVRAIVLKDLLLHQHIGHIYSTNTARTLATADPLSLATKVRIEVYRDIDSLVTVLRSSRQNALVVGHANTVDDIVNKLCGGTLIAADLPDREYDNLFVVKRHGKKGHLERRKYGYPSNP